MPKTLKERLLRVGFAPIDVEAAIKELGPDVHIDEAGRWIALASLKRIFDTAGIREYVRMENDRGR